MSETEDDFIESRCTDFGGLEDNSFERVSVDMAAETLPSATFPTINIEHLAATAAEVSRDSIDAIAARLIKERLILTALELHMELMESGRELARLRDFFSNPSNFERTRLNESSSPPGNLPRTSSVQTFDSLDFARYSDDGDRNESDRVAVLEFDLRKAQDTIKSLRAALTQSAEIDVGGSAAVSCRYLDNQLACMTRDGMETDEEMRPLEKRAVNFLVNEYLLRFGYKLTSVTFSEENESQDFEDWDDVGINISKPPDLLRLYRDYGQHVVPRSEKKDVACEADLDDVLHGVVQEIADASSEVIHDSRILTDDAMQDDLDLHGADADNISDCIAENITSVEEMPVAQSNTALSDSTVNADSSAAESSLLDNCEYDSSHQQRPSTSTALSCDDEKQHIFESSNAEENDQTSDINAIDDGSHVTKNDALGTNMDSRTKSSETLAPDTGSWQPDSRQASSLFRSALLRAALHGHAGEHIDLTDDTSVVTTLGDCLPRVIPNVLLARRDELIPLLVLASTLHPDSSKRDALLHELFNLIKRPDAEQRRTILAGCVVFAQHAGAARVSSELLPQCWEQIEHKHPERRLLVAEACGVLAPYIPNDMRGSLVLSILQQMLEDKTEDVREAVVLSLGALAGWVDDVDKFQTITSLFFSTLVDSSERISKASLDVLLPSSTVWAVELQRLETAIVQPLLDNIDKCLQISTPSTMQDPRNVMADVKASAVVTDQKRFTLYVLALQQSIPFLLVNVLKSGPFSDKLKEVYAEEAVVGHIPEPVSDLVDISVIIGNRAEFVQIFSAYDRFIGEEWYELWDAFSWISVDLVDRLLHYCTLLEPTQVTVRPLSRLFSLLCRTFGRTFTITKVIPRFHKAIYNPTAEGSYVFASAVFRCASPVYACGVLSAFTLLEEDRKRLEGFMSAFLGFVAHNMTQSDNRSLQASFMELCSGGSHQEMLLRVLWEAVVDPSPRIRATAGQMFDCVVRGGLSDGLISARVLPALVTLASDSEMSVRVATVSTFGRIVEVCTERSILEKVYMQFQTFMDDPVYRSTGEQYSLYVELIKTFGRIGPTAEPKFRDDFVLPRLMALAAENQMTTNEKRKAAVALQLFETFTALSCCFISDHIIKEVMVPGLKCLVKDLQLVAPDHVGIVTSMIRDFEDRVSESAHAGRLSAEGAGFADSSGLEEASSTGDVMKAKVLNRFKDVKDRASHSQLSRMFSGGKK